MRYLIFFGDAKIFDFPKPSGLIRHLLKIGTARNEHDLVLDFFAGSCSTAHAIMAENAEDGGNRKFIAVQLPGKCQEETQAFKAGFHDISQIGKERIRRVSAKFSAEEANQLNLLTKVKPTTLALEFSP